MGDVRRERRRFLDALGAISEGRSDAEALTRAFRSALLGFGSETPDNLSCAAQLEVGAVAHEVGLKLTARPVLLSDIAHLVEDEPMPDSIRSAYPDMTPDEWSAYSRMTTLMFALLSRGERQAS